jgi:hypothetical protein
VFICEKCICNVILCTNKAECGIKIPTFTAFKKARAGGVTQAIENLSIQCKILSSNPSTDKKKKK